MTTTIQPDTPLFFNPSQTPLLVITRMGLEKGLEQIKIFNGVTGQIRYKKGAVLRTMAVIQNKGNKFQYEGVIEPIGFEFE